MCSDNPKLSFSILIVVLSLAACSEPDSIPDTSTSPGDVNSVSATETTAEAINPFYTESPLYLNFPAFDRIQGSHFLPAFERGMTEQLAEVEAIATQAAAPDFENTIVALELSGQLLNRVSSVFSNLASAHTNDEISALEQQLRPLLAAHDDEILFNKALYGRIQELFENRETLQLDAVSERLLVAYHTDFVRAGAALTEQQQLRMRDINSQLSLLQIRYNQNILNEMNDLDVVVDSREELTGLDEQSLSSASATANARNLPGKFVIPLLNTTTQPALASLQNRNLRERIHRASLSRGNRGGEFDNREILVSILRLRAESAQLLGYDTYADFVLEKQTASTVGAVNSRLSEMVPAAVANARLEAAELQQMIVAEGEDFELAAWDWSYYSEKLRTEKFSFDAGELRPYFELNNVLQRGVFYAAQMLYGVTFHERTDFPVYHEDVRVFEVMDAVGTSLGIFMADYYARPSKRGGAWNSAYIVQSDLLGTQPIIANHVNIRKPAAGEATLLSIEEVTTLFHEFGHALHGMLSSVYYPYFSGTRVPRDFVEFPSQVNEMWATWPEVLSNYALHYQTGEPMSPQLLERVLAAEQFNQGYATTENLAASILDQALHQLDPADVPDEQAIMAFETKVLNDAQFPVDIVPPRYSSTYFRHIMGGYAAGYYSYLWSEVLDADTVEWFKENGGLSRRNGDHFRQTLLSKGGSVDSMTLFRDFRGRDADILPLLKRRGLAPQTP